MIAFALSKFRLAYHDYLSERFNNAVNVRDCSDIPEIVEINADIALHLYTSMAGCGIALLPQTENPFEIIIGDTVIDIKKLLTLSENGIYILRNPEELLKEIQSINLHILSEGTALTTVLWYAILHKDSISVYNYDLDK